MRLISALVLVALPFSANAHDYRIGDLVIDHPMAAETQGGITATAGAAYMIITNNGDTDARLIDIRADFPRVMMHETVIENEIASMTHMESVTIPAGESITFEPGGMHIMFMGLNGDPFDVGEKIPATLVFETLGELDVVFNVEALDHHH